MNQNNKSQTYALVLVASLCVIGAFAFRSKWNVSFFEFLGFEKAAQEQASLDTPAMYEYPPEPGNALVNPEGFSALPKIDDSFGFDDFNPEERPFANGPETHGFTMPETAEHQPPQDVAVGFADLREDMGISSSATVVHPIPGPSEVMPVQYSTEFPNNRPREYQDNFADFNPPPYQPINPPANQPTNQPANQWNHPQNAQDHQARQPQPNIQPQPQPYNPNQPIPGPHFGNDHNIGSNIATGGFVIPDPSNSGFASGSQPSQPTNSEFVIPETSFNPPPSPIPSPTPAHNPGPYGTEFTGFAPNIHNNFSADSPNFQPNDPTNDRQSIYPQHPQPGLYDGRANQGNSGEFFNPNTGIRTESVIVELEPLTGTDMVARVGSRVILECDIISQARRVAVMEIKERLESLNPEERKEISQYMIDKEINNVTAAAYQFYLQEQVRIALLYNDFLAFQTKEGVEQIKKNIATEFDSKEIPEMLKLHKLSTLAELKAVLENEFGSTIERERQLFVEQMIAMGWMANQIQPADAECTYPQMREYYETNIKDYEITGKVRWEQLSVHFSKHSSEEAAYEKIRQLGNMVVAGSPFPEIARRESEAFNAKDGGYHDWTEQDSLKSKVIDNELFTMPLHRLSRILRDDTGFHIVRVLEREEKSHKPFNTLQKEISEKIKKERTEKLQREYFESLQERFPIEIIKPEWKPPIRRN